MSVSGDCALDERDEGWLTGRGVVPTRHDVRLEGGR